MPYSVSSDDGAKCYTWSKYSERKRLVGSSLITVACSGCRAIHDSQNGNVDMPKRTYYSGSKKWLKIDSNEIHICEPKELATVRF